MGKDIAAGKGFPRLSDRAFFIVSIAVLAAIIAILALAAIYFLDHVYTLGDIHYFYSMVDVILKGGTPYVDYKDSKPPLIYLAFSVPALVGYRIAGSVLLVSACNLASAVLVLGIGWKLYGRAAGLLAAVFFAINMAWAEGYFPLIEPFVVVFLLLAAYFLLFGGRHKYLYAGLSTGVALGFKQYAILFLPIVLLLLYRKRELKGAPAYVTGMLLPLVLAFGAIFTAYGQEAGQSALYMSFGFAESYISQGYSGELTGYNLSGLFGLLVNVVIGTSLFVSPLLFALLAWSRSRRTAEVEFFALLGVIFAATVIIRPFFHYWALAMPFVSLTCAAIIARQAVPGNTGQPGTLSKLVLPGSALIYGIVLALFSVGSLMVARGFLDDLGQFRTWAGILASAADRYLGWGAGEREPLFAFGTDTAMGLVVVAALCLVCALLAARIGHKLGGRAAGAIAGLLFTLNIGWAIGSLAISDVLALALMLLSILALSGSHTTIRPASGLLAGTAAVFTPYAVAAVPASLYYLWKKGGIRHSGLYGIGVLLPLVVYVLAMAAGVVPVSQGLSGLVVTCGPGIPAQDNPFLASANVIAAISVLTSVFLLAAAGFFSRRQAGGYDVLLFACLVLFTAALPIGLYLRYWIFALPFAAVLCARLFTGDHKVIMTTGE